MESGVVTAWGGEEEDDGEGMGVEEKGRLARSRRRSNSPSKANRKSEQKKKTERGSQSAARKEKLDETDFCALCGLCSLNALDLAALRQYMGTDTIGSSAPSLSDVELCTTLIFCDSCDITYHLACVGMTLCMRLCTVFTFALSMRANMAGCVRIYVWQGCRTHQLVSGSADSARYRTATTPRLQAVSIHSHLFLVQL